jgi:hypothetical protein
MALASQHRGLLERQQALATKLQQVAGSLAKAPAGEQLALLRQHAWVHTELRELQAQLEDTALQLMALRQAGLL